MSTGIRFNKVVRELNIGLQTAVEFLEKRKELGEVKSDPNFKLNDKQYNALVELSRKTKRKRTMRPRYFLKNIRKRNSVSIPSTGQRHC